MVRTDLWKVLSETQAHISKYYATALTDESKHDELKNYIEKFILDSGYIVDGFDDDGLISRLYSEMVEYSILTPYLGSPDLDEININSWDDVVLTFSDGRMEKTSEHFRDPQHAVDIVKRLLHHSGMIIDNATPIAQGHLPNNTRTPDREVVRQQGLRVKAPNEAMFTLTVTDVQGVIEKGCRIRKLMPIECWRLQGFTDEQFRRAEATGLKDGRLYKMAGNAVSVPVITALGDFIKELENGEQQRSEN